MKITFKRKTIWLLLLLIPLVGLAAGWGAAQLRSEDNQKPQLVYLSQPGSEQAALLGTDLSGQTTMLLQNFGQLMEMKPSPQGSWLAMVLQSAQGEQTVQVYSFARRKVIQRYDCGTAVCSALSWRADESELYFQYARITSTGDLNAQHQILAMEIPKGTVEALTFKEGIRPLYYSLSPDGQYRAIYDEQKMGYHILDQAGTERVLILSQDVSPVVWLQNPARVLLILSENQDKIPVTHILEFNLETLQRRFLTNPQNSNMDYSTLLLHPDGESILFGCRPVLRMLSRQICTATLSEFTLQNWTTNPTRNHNSMVLSPDGSLVAYQALDLSSSSARPSIWIRSWRDGAENELAQDAAMPQWIP